MDLAHADTAWPWSRTPRRRSARPSTARRSARLADFTCFSFHPRKSITTGEGGLITTDDDAAAERLRALRSHGVSTSAFARHASGTTDIEEYREVGWNYRMTDIQAAVGLVQLGKLDGVLAERRRLAAALRPAARPGSAHPGAVRAAGAPAHLPVVLRLAARRRSRAQTSWRPWPSAASPPGAA